MLRREKRFLHLTLKRNSACAPTTHRFLGDLYQICTKSLIISCAPRSGHRDLTASQSKPSQLLNASVFLSIELESRNGAYPAPSGRFSLSTKHKGSHRRTRGGCRAPRESRAILDQERGRPAPCPSAASYGPAPATSSPSAFVGSSEENEVFSLRRPVGMSEYILG